MLVLTVHNSHTLPMSAGNRQISSLYAYLKIFYFSFCEKSARDTKRKKWNENRALLSSELWWYLRFEPGTSEPEVLFPMFSDITD